MPRSVRLDLPLLLPDVPDLRDRCVARLIDLVSQRAGVLSAHVVRGGNGESAGQEGDEACVVPDGASAPSGTPHGAQLCLHYDPDRLTLAQVTDLARAAGAGVVDRFAHMLVTFRAVGSEDEGLRLEQGLRDLPGVTAASVNFASQLVRVEYDRTRVDARAILAQLAELGVTPSDTSGRDTAPRGRAARPIPPESAPAAAASEVGAEAQAVAAELEDHDHEQEAAGWYTRNRELAWSLIAGALLLAGWLVERSYGLGPAALVLLIASYFFGARDNVGHSLKDLRKGHFRFNIDLLMVVAAIGAAILGQWAEGALLLFLFSLGHALEHYALGRARNAIKALGELVPQVATVVRGGQERDIPISQVQRGDSVMVKPAARIPVDGTVREGSSAVNQAPITGESMPVGKSPGETVFAGTVNGEGALVVEVTAAVGDRTLDRVIRLVAEAQTQKAPTQQFTDRFERVFVPAVLVADLLLIVIPPLFGIWPLAVSFYRAMGLLVAASPCALALGTPAAVLAGIAQAARNGVLIKGGAYLETLGTIDVLALDKTGTITKGEPEVTDVVPLGALDERALLAVTAAVERRSQHPLAHAILSAAEERGIALPAATDVQSTTGRGVRATVNGAVIEAGRLRLFEDQQVTPPERVRAAVSDLEQRGRTTVVVRRASGAGGEEWLGVLGIADQPRAQVAETLSELRRAGVHRIIMLTGDNEGVGRAIASSVGIDDVRANLLPEGKAEAIQVLVRDTGGVAMVGDGVNDAPALAHATVGIAMGGAGTAAALETADIALMGDDLGRLPFAVGLSHRARAVIRQNLYISLGVIAVLIVATVAGIASIGVAVIVHEGSTLVVVGNGLRLLTYGDPRRRR